VSYNIVLGIARMISGIVYVDSTDFLSKPQCQVF
jgi:hypothetical protein